MNTYPVRRAAVAVALVGAAAFAMGTGAFVRPAVSYAEKIWDIGAYDTCMKAAEDRRMADKTDAATFHDEIRYCCEMSGGEWSGGTGPGQCTAPPATAQTAQQSPGQVVSAPSAGTADPGRNPERTGGGAFEVVPIGPGGPVLYLP